MFSESRKIIFASRQGSCSASEYSCPRPNHPASTHGVFLSPKPQPQTFRTSRTPAVGVWRSKERTSRSKPGRRLAISSPMSLKKCLCGSGTDNMDGPWAKNGRMVSRPTFRPAERLLGLRQSDPAQQIGITRIGAHPVPEDVYT